jgi:hypothetical protein
MPGTLASQILIIIAHKMTTIKRVPPPLPIILMKAICLKMKSNKMRILGERRIPIREGEAIGSSLRNISRMSLIRPRLAPQMRSETHIYRHLTRMRAWRRPRA